MIYKTKLCKFFQSNGFCKFEDNCRFAHGQNELRDNPNKKTTLCQFFMQGNCLNGNNCHHAHGEHELVSQETNPYYKSTLCSYFEQGHCSNKQCSFAHGVEELRPKPN